MKIAFLGDMALFGINTAKNKDYKKRFELVTESLSQYDYIIGNLETPLTTSQKEIGGKSAYIKGDPEDIALLEHLRITHVTLANNHIFDYGKEGLDDTINLLEHTGIEWVGIHNKTALIKGDNSKLVLHGYCCYSTNGKGMGKYVDILDPLKVENEIKQDEEMGSLSVLACHWGQEHVHFPNYDHVKLCRRICDGRSVIVYGHHPHVIQGIESIGNSVVAYSLGNFCFDDVYTNKSKKPLIELSSDNKDVLILGITIENNRITNIDYMPFRFDGGLYRREPELLSRIREWSNYLDTEENIYENRRNSLLSEYYNKRKSMRDAEWYVKRMNPESVKMILSGLRNRKEYNTIVKSFLER